MITYINRIVWRFVKYEPDDYKLLDARYNVMKNLVLGDCDHLIKFILFGDQDDDKEARKLHIPRETPLNKVIVDGEETTNVMELAICHCQGKL